MKRDMEDLWLAMKESHYKRSIDQLNHRIHETKDLDDALTAALGMVVETIHAQTGTFWFYERSGDGRIHPRAVYGGADMSDICLLPGAG